MSKHQGHIRNVSTLSLHLSTPVRTSDFQQHSKISSLKDDRSLSDLLFSNSPEENFEKRQNSIFSPTDGNSLFYIYFIYIKRTFPSIGRQYTRIHLCVQHESNTYPHIHISTTQQHHCEDVARRRRKDLLPTRVPGRARVRVRVCVM